jgi:acetaldehyde dehydrogenase (acetylating)
MSDISLPGTQELMRHGKTAVILATGGADMVRAAHSMGKPAYGVGPGNVPCYVDRSADIKTAASLIVSSKSFDNSVICATEQAVVADRPIAAALRTEMERLGAHFVNPAQAAGLSRVLFLPLAPSIPAKRWPDTAIAGPHGRHPHPRRRPHPGRPVAPGGCGRTALR